MKTRIIQLLRETITVIGMSTENAKIECPAKRITHAFIYFNDNNERNKYVRSANMLRKELRGRYRYHDQRMQKKEFITRDWGISNVAFARDAAHLLNRFH